MLLSSIKGPEAHVESEGTSGLFEALSLNPSRNYQVAHLSKTLLRRMELCIRELRNQPVPTVRPAGKVARLERGIIPTRFKTTNGGKKLLGRRKCRWVNIPNIDPKGIGCEAVKWV